MVRFLLKKACLYSVRQWVTEVPEDTGHRTFRERFAHATFKYWLNALLKPAKLVRLAC
jgi:hypothetical protein